MSLRSSELAELAEELTRELVGAVVQKVQAPTSSRIYLELRVPGRSVVLLLCAEPGVARVSVVEERPPGPPVPPGWQSVLRRELTGARLRSAAALVDGRTLVLCWTGGRGGGAESEGDGPSVVLEAGREPTVALLSPQARVLCLSRPARSDLRVGATWEAPPATAPGSAPRSPSRLSEAPGGAPERLLRRAEELFAGEERAAWVRSQRAPLLAHLKRLERTRDKVRADRARAAQAEQLRREAELLQQNQHHLERGATTATVVEYLPDGGTREVAIGLNPARTIRGEIEHRFHQYRRLLRGAQHAAVRFAQLDLEEAELRRSVAALEEAKVGAPLPPAKHRRGPAAASLPYREYLGADGRAIWVGRGARQNDALTFGAAKPWHLWLHVRGVPGAHVVIPLQKGESVPSELLIDAAHLALHHSDLKGEPRAEVSYVHVKHLRRAGAPGAVTYTREQTLVLRVEPARLTRLLSAGAMPSSPGEGEPQGHSSA